MNYYIVYQAKSKLFKWWIKETTEKNKENDLRNVQSIDGVYNAKIVDETEIGQYFEI